MVGVAAFSGASAGLLPSVIGVAIGVVAGNAAPAPPGFGGLVARLVAGLPWPAVLAVTLVSTLVSVGLTVGASKVGSSVAGEVTAAIRIEMLRGALFASPKAVDKAGRASVAQPPGNAPPGFKAPDVRGGDLVKLTIARESALAGEFLVSMMTGLPQALVTIVVLGIELVRGGTAVVLVGGVVLFVTSRLAADRASRRVADAMRSMQQADAGIFASLGEKLTQSEELMLLGARGEALREFAETAFRCADARDRFTSALAVAGQIKSVFTAMSPLLILLAVVASGRSHDAGQVAKLLLYAPLLMARFEVLDALRTGLIERGPVLRAATRLFDLAPSPATRTPLASAGDVKEGAIEVRDLRFTPEGGKKPVLDGVSFTIPPGSIVGVCGPSGCGKSTLLRLLLRLEDPDEGAIEIDGVDLRHFDGDAVAQTFGVVGQSSRLFERSVRQNLSVGLGRPADDVALREVLRRVKLDELASEEASSRSLSTEFKAVPPNFSGGEQRRLLMARMLVREAKIFVLDEPEAGLPSATAESILREISAMAKGRTCVVVTHAPHLLASSFNVVLEAGRIADIGTHAALVERSPTYRALLAEGLREGPSATKPVSREPSSTAPVSRPLPEPVPR